MAIFLTFSPILLYTFLITATSYFALHYLIYTKRIAQWRKSNIPFLKPTFLIGHKYFFNLLKNSHLVSLDRIYRETTDKEAVGFFLGTMPLILIRNPRLIQQVFAKNFDKTFQLGWAHAAQDEISQNMIQLASDKEMWKSNRDTLLPTFSSSRLGGGNFAKVTDQVEKMWAHIDEVRESGPVNISKTFDNCALNIYGTLNWSQDIDSFKGEGGEFYQSFTKLYGPPPSKVKMLGFFAQIRSPGISWLPDSLKFVTQEQIGAMTQLLSHQIQKREQHKSSQNDFLDFLMTLRNGAVSKGGKMTSGISMNQMVGLALGGTIVGGGYAAQNLSVWAIHLLSLHPEYQKRVRDELLQVMRKHETSELTFDVVQELAFMHQCLLEVIRLYPSFSHIMRICSEDFQVPGTEYIFKKGDKVIMDPYSVHRDPKYFANPDTFYPERFSPENKKSIAPESFLGFGIGPRKCPGSKLGIMFITIMVASLLLKYDIKPRSHKMQMQAVDFHPGSFDNIPRNNLLVDLLPHKITA